MKKILLPFAIIALFSVTTDAQKIAYVDINQILESMDEYKKAQTQLDRVAAKWRREISEQYDEIKGMYNRYQAEQVLLSEDMKKQREEAIMDKEKQVRELQKDRFGPEGSLFKKREELVKPIQERVYTAIEDYANDRGYDFIFDKSGAAGIIFSNPDYNKTDDILKRLGIE